MQSDLSRIIQGKKYIIMKGLFYLLHICRKKESYQGYLAHCMFVKSAKNEGKDLLIFFLDEVAIIEQNV